MLITAVRGIKTALAKRPGAGVFDVRTTGRLPTRIAVSERRKSEGDLLASGSRRSAKEKSPVAERNSAQRKQQNRKSEDLANRARYLDSIGGTTPTGNLGNRFGHVQTRAAQRLT